ncbi:hypothetical protein [Phaeobacter sp. C3_T13_0]|uniref:hypothetical protein n=1 Tax=Phaeobacter cretensis TaxID=3342641 RepID=UPI0039BD5EEC
MLRRLMNRLGFIPKRIITDKRAAKREFAPSLDHWSHKGRNNRAKNSHLPFRKQKRAMQGYRSQGGLQRFVATNQPSGIASAPPAHRRSASTIRYHRLEAFDVWNAVTHVA